MKTVKMLVELTYDNDMMHEDDADGIAWFNDEVLGGYKIEATKALLTIVITFILGVLATGFIDKVSTSLKERGPVSTVATPVK